MELLLMGLGGCSGIDVMMMLEKGKQDVKDCQMEVTSERADGIPAVYPSSASLTASNILSLAEI
jgi:putative redox protein